MRLTIALLVSSLLLDPAYASVVSFSRVGGCLAEPAFDLTHEAFQVRSLSALLRPIPERQPTKRLQAQPSVSLPRELLEALHKLNRAFNEKENPKTIQSLQDSAQELMNRVRFERDVDDALLGNAIGSVLLMDWGIHNQAIQRVFLNLMHTRLRYSGWRPEFQPIWNVFVGQNEEISVYGDVVESGLRMMANTPGLPETLLTGLLLDALALEWKGDANEITTVQQGIFDAIFGIAQHHAPEGPWQAIHEAIAPPPSPQIDPDLEALSEDAQQWIKGLTWHAMTPPSRHFSFNIDSIEQRPDGDLLFRLRYPGETTLYHFVTDGFLNDPLSLLQALSQFSGLAENGLRLLFNRQTYYQLRVALIQWEGLLNKEYGGTTLVKTIPRRDPAKGERITRDVTLNTHGDWSVLAYRHTSEGQREIVRIGHNVWNFSVLGIPSAKMVMLKLTPGQPSLLGWSVENSEIRLVLSEDIWKEMGDALKEFQDVVEREDLQITLLHSQDPLTPVPQASGQNAVVQKPVEAIPLPVEPAPVVLAESVPAKAMAIPVFRDPEPELEQEIFDMVVDHRPHEVLTMLQEMTLSSEELRHFLKRLFPSIAPLDERYRINDLMIFFNGGNLTGGWFSGYDRKNHVVTLSENSVGFRKRAGLSLPIPLGHLDVYLLAHTKDVFLARLLPELTPFEKRVTLWKWSAKQFLLEQWTRFRRHIGLMALAAGALALSHVSPNPPHWVKTAA